MVNLIAWLVFIPGCCCTVSSRTSFYTIVGADKYVYLTSVSYAYVKSVLMVSCFGRLFDYLS